MKKNSALANLGWPYTMMEQEGTLSWSIRESEPVERFGNAIVSYRDNAITAIASLRDVSGAQVSEVELRWSIAGGAVVESSSKMDGEPRDFGVAIEAFQSILAKAGEPVFTPSTKPAAAPAPRSGAL